MSGFRQVLLILIVSILVGCTIAPAYNYAQFREHRPKSILVLPPINETKASSAPYQYLATITRPLAECGYYVFPVAVIEQLMKENEVPSVEDMHSLALSRIDDIIGADAVLYITIEKWGQNYVVTQTITEVSIRFELVDVKTGAVIWQGRQDSKVGSGNNAYDPLITSAIDKTAKNNLKQQIYEVARQANYNTFSALDSGLLVGPYLQNAPSEYCQRPPMWSGGFGRSLRISNHTQYR